MAAEGVCHAAAGRAGVPAGDILQVWLDVSNHPARGKDQADLLCKRDFPRFSIGTCMTAESEFASAFVQPVQRRP